MAPASGGAPSKNAQGFNEFMNEKDGSVLIEIPGCTFTMGSADGAENEKPPHRVSVESFSTGKYPTVVFIR